MEDLKLWRVKRNGSATPSAESIVEVRNTETEKMLEDLLTASPDLLEPDLFLIGRQFATENGPLDLMAIDSSGKLVVAELKRGALTRDAVAQVLDYTSWLAALSAERFAADVAIQSGKRGIRQIEDLEAWYSDNFGAVLKSALQTPRILLVGVGIDDTARRMVKYLGSFGLDISVVTFHAYDVNGETFLARSVEIDAADTPATNAGGEPTSRAANESNLAAMTGKAGITDLFNEVRTVVADALRSPNRGGAKKSGVTFYRPCWAESKGHHKAYVKLEPDDQPGRLFLVLMDRAKREGGPAVDELLAKFPAKKLESHHGYDEHELTVDASNWPAIRPMLIKALEAVADGIDAAGEETPGDE